jgi:Pvc16 N-terminal domain
MALANTGRAIGAVTQTLRERLTTAMGAAVSQVSVGRPEPPGGNTQGSRLNLFLYEVHVDEFLRNESLDEGQPPPLWLVLSYLITAFDESGESDSIDAHSILGAGMRALQAANYLQPTIGTTDPLRDNPNELKVTFDATTVDLLSKLMQGPDMKYRCSAAFQVRPVLIAPAEPPAYAQLVGVDYTAGSALIGEKGIHIPVQPSLGRLLAVADRGRAREVRSGCEAQSHWSRPQPRGHRDSNGQCRAADDEQIAGHGAMYGPIGAGCGQFAVGGQPADHRGSNPIDRPQVFQQHCHRWAASARGHCSAQRGNAYQSEPRCAGHRRDRPDRDSVEHCE